MGAINIPLFDNDVRAMIGTLYKKDQEAAYDQGFKKATERFPDIHDKIKQLKKDNPDKEIVVFCFRGGTRSKSVHVTLNLVKFNNYKLEGGYKAYRNYIFNNVDKLAQKVNFLVVTGNTGSGKTHILRSLMKEDYPVIDLEGLANNKQKGINK